MKLIFVVFAILVTLGGLGVVAAFSLRQDLAT